MFTAEMRCDSCGGLTREFLIGYVSDSDTIDVLFQDTRTGEFRVVTCHPAATREADEDEI